MRRDGGRQRERKSPHRVRRRSILQLRRGDDDKLTKARDALKAEGIEATLDENVDIIEELKTIDGVDASDVDKFETQSTAAAAGEEAAPAASAAARPGLVVDDDDATPRLGAGSAAFASACAFLTVALFA